MLGKVVLPVCLTVFYLHGSIKQTHGLINRSDKNEICSDASDFSSVVLYYDPSYGIGPYFDRKSYEEEAFDGYVVWDFRDELYKLRHLPKNNGAIENSEDEVCVYEE